MTLMPHGVTVLLASASLVAQTPAHGQRRDSIRVAAGPHYDAGGLHRFLFGGDYRDLWRATLSVPMLNLDTASGGLTPTTAGGGFQTKSLRFRGANGFLYGFRSVDKDPAILPAELAGTFVDDLVRDQTSSAHPAAAGIVPPLLEAVGILHTVPRLVLLPDDPKLGEFRERFAGTLGYFELLGIVEPGAQQFGNALEILGSDDVYAMVRKSPAHRIDTRQFLTARLIDLLIGDWDRHRGQWGWARFADAPAPAPAAVTYWTPIPEDRDQAFARFDGAFLSLGRVAAPQLVNYGDDYPNMVGLTWNGRESDRWFLVQMEKPVWDSVAAAVQARLTDAVIDAAVAGMPVEYQAIDGDRLRRALRARRDKLLEATDRFYRVVVGEVDLHATEAAELITIDRHTDGRLAVEITERRPGATPWLRRTFDASETSEIRLYLYGGDDRVVVRGDGRGIGLRIIGGGNDEVVDSSRAGGVRFYATGADRASGPTRVHVDRRVYAPPPKRFETELPARDWGHRWLPVLWAGGGPDIGVFAGVGGFVTRWGFRKLPFAYRVRVRGGYATAARAFRTDLLATFYRVNSRVHGDIYARASGIEVLRFHGLGNETPLDRPDYFYRVTQNQYTIQPTLTLPLSTPATITFGPLATLSDTEAQPNRIIDSLRPYGDGHFSQVGWQTSVRFDTRDATAAASRGVAIEVGGTIYPELLDVVEGTFGEAHATASTYLSVGGAGAPGATLALRVGGKKVWGTFPFHEAAFIGDDATVRLGRQNRFGGDAAAWGNAELRLRVAKIFFPLPGHFGLLGLADAGRVFLEGESSDAWHTAFGGGIWLSFLQPSNTVNAAVAHSDDGVRIYVRAGFAY